MGNCKNNCNGTKSEDLDEQEIDILPSSIFQSADIPKFIFLN